MWLDRLVAATHARVERGFYDARPEGSLRPGPSMRAAIERAYPAILAELKPARPEGKLPDVDLGEQAHRYAAGGACGISVLTDPDHFDGALETIEVARTTGLPVLMKDFLVHPAQLDAAQGWGASAVLAIARIHEAGLTETSLEAMVQAAHERDLEVLCEVVTAEELDAALAAGADILGINARDLDTLELDMDRTQRLLRGRAIDVPVLHLSGIQGPGDVARALKAGASGVLVGTALMESEDPVQALRRLQELPP